MENKKRLTDTMEMILLALYENPRLWLTTMDINKMVHGTATDSGKNRSAGSVLGRYLDKKYGFVETIAKDGRSPAQFKITPDGQEYVRNSSLKTSKAAALMAEQEKKKTEAEQEKKEAELLKELEDRRYNLVERPPAATIVIEAPGMRISITTRGGN